MVVYVVAPRELEGRAYEEARRVASETGDRVVVILVSNGHLPGVLGEKAREAVRRKTVVVWSPA